MCSPQAKYEVEFAAVEPGRVQQLGNQPQQLVGLALADAGGLADGLFRAWLAAAEYIAEDAGAIGLPVLLPAQHRAQ